MAGFRGRAGELTVRVASGNAMRWTALSRVLIGAEGEASPVSFRIEHARGYRDRLVLKLAGVDDAQAADRLRGRLVLAPAEEVPGLGDAEHFVVRLVGLAVLDERGEMVGTIRDVVETGGVDLLVVEQEDREEILVPLARAFVPRIDEASGVVHVRLPEGLRGLNRRGGPA